MRRSESSARILCLAVLAGTLAVGGAAAGEAGTESEDGRVREVLEWRQERLQSLTAGDGWLTLTGLFWLEEGESTCGSDPGSDVVLPASAPRRTGVLKRAGGEVELVLEPGVEATIDGRPAGRATLATDAGGEPTRVELGTVSFYLIERDGRIGVRVKDRDHPHLKDFRGLDYYPVDLRWRVDARFEPYDPPKKVPVPTVLGTISEEESPGAVVFRLAAHDHRLDALPGGDGELFFVFGDKTNGGETYGGGRFLYAPVADAGGRVVLDFNRSYNPPCAFTPFATCPLPPPENKLGLAVRAGEKKYGGDH
jgi:uncharacterized protein (DUF1684 family)